MTAHLIPRSRPLQTVLVVLAMALSVLSGAAAERPAAAASPSGPAVRGTTAGLAVTIVSNRPDMVSGGDALVEVSLPAGANPADVTVKVDDRDVTGAFAVRDDGRHLGLVTGLVVGTNRLVVALPDGRRAEIDVVNHPIGGPLFTGPQIQPWFCITEEQGLGAPQDAQCNVDPVISWYYRDAVTGHFITYDPAAPVPDGMIATVPTPDGETVPFIVRLEEGVINRGIYSVAVVADPTVDPAEGPKPWASPAAWNGTLVYQFGGGSNPHYGQGADVSTLDPTALGQGFLVAGNGMTVHANNVQDNVAAETVLMMKEHINETYGPIRRTVATGCSGGAIQQSLMPSMYPGILDGLIPSCSFPDLWTPLMEITDCHLLHLYFLRAPDMWPEARDRYHVMGKGDVDGCVLWANTFATLGSPSAEDEFKNCGISEDQIYHPEDNPEGVRCSVADYQSAIWGSRPPEVWTEVEQQIGRGFAPRAYDNVGVQYGLGSLAEGVITPAQFVHLNSQIGGFDIDARPIPERTVAAEETLEIAYRTGQVSDASFWANVPIIDLRGHSHAEWHQDVWSYSARARLDEANGHHDNQVIWTGPIAGFGDPAFGCAITEPRHEVPGYVTPATPPELCTSDPMAAMDQWLRAIEADTAPGSQAEKVVRNRPEEVVDACWIGGTKTTDAETCATAYPPNSAPRITAGSPLTHDILKCALQPLARAAYPVEFTDDDWATLQAAFPEGVCDFTQPGVQQRGAEPWQSFADGPGGRTIPAPEESVALAADDISVIRHGGADRIATAVEVSGRGRSAAEVAVLARADDFPDALAGAPLAVSLDAPLLLTRSTGLSQATAAELRRLGVTEVVLLGGQSAMGPQVEADLVAMGVAVRRIGGADRFETAALIAAELPSGAEAFVVSGATFADAVLASSLASATGGPIIPVGRNHVPAASAGALDGRETVTIVGGDAVVDPSVATALGADGAQVGRIAGEDRYATAIAVAREAMRRGVASPSTIWVASGEEFPDALTAGAAAGRSGGIVLLVRRQGPPPEATATFFAEVAADVRTLRIAGGAAAVPESVAMALAP